MPHSSSTMLVVGHGILYVEEILSYYGNLNVIFPTKIGQKWSVKQHNTLLKQLLLETPSILDFLQYMEDERNITDVLNISHRSKDLDMNHNLARQKIKKMNWGSVEELMDWIQKDAVEGNRPWELYKHTITSADDLLDEVDPPLLPNKITNGEYMHYNLRNNATLDGSDVGLMWRIYINPKKLRKLLEHPADETIISEQFYYMTPYAPKHKKASMDMVEVLYMIPKIHILCDKADSNLIKMVYLEEARDHKKVEEAEQACQNMCDITLPADSNVIWGTCRDKGNIVRLWSPLSSAASVSPPDSALPNFPDNDQTHKQCMLLGYQSAYYDDYPSSE